MEFASELIRWYKKNLRDLPWRHTRDPYRIWLSEVVLQQTRVDQGTSYYHRLLDAFPDVQALANAEEEEVLKVWQGLGYYSRARNLHGTAKIVAKTLKGQFPQSSLELQKLKGIGPYTAAAMASFCFNEVVPVMDGNVIRLVSRYFGVEEAVDQLQGKRTIEALMVEHISKKDPATFNQAIMEFGALQCTPGQPNCDECPFFSSCAARKRNRVSKLPLKTKKTAVKDIWFFFFVVREKGHIYLRKRTHSGIWKNLYDFPAIESDVFSIEKEVKDQFISQFEMIDPMEVIRRSEEYIHVLSHRRIHAYFIEVKIKKKWKKGEELFLRIEEEDIHKYSVPRLIEQYISTFTF